MAVSTRAHKELIDYLDKKFDEQKTNFVSILKEEVIGEIQLYLKEQDHKIVKLESTVSVLQTQVNYLKQSNENKLEELEQYGRRQCFRIEGIPAKVDEKSDEVLQKVFYLITESETDIPNDVVDRAHRIGKPYQDRDSEIMCQSIMVKFSTFRHRTLFYRRRKKLGNNVRIKLDLTKKRYKILSDSIEYVKQHTDKVEFVYIDVNCRLKVHFL